MTPTDSPQPDSEREAFEAWWVERFKSPIAISLWEVWQAARASLPVALPPPTYIYHPGDGTDGSDDLYEYAISGDVDIATDCKTCVRLYTDDQLRAAIEAASRGTGDAWVSVEERLPEKRAVVLYFDTERGPWVGIYYGSETFASRVTRGTSSVTHWMPLPAPPASAHPGAGDRD